MEARTRLVALVIISGALLIVSSAEGASARSRHFLVKAPTQAQAERIAKAAEDFRRDLAVEWLGHELEPWPDVCPIVCDVAPNNPAGGATSFIFQQGQPRAWQMSVQGSEERVLDSVLPHEITHTIFATHFGRPLPRWADEGACTTVEHESEIAKHRKLLIEFLHTNRGIPFNRMFAMQDYPSDILPLYSQGHSVAKFLIQQGGKRKYIKFVEDGLSSNRWPEVVQRHYGFPDLSELQLTWVEWVREGEPLVSNFQDERYLAAVERVGGADPELLASNGRSNSPRSNGELAALERNRPSRSGRARTRYERQGDFDRESEQSLAPISNGPSRRGVRPASAEVPIDAYDEGDESLAYNDRPQGRSPRRNIPDNPMRSRSPSGAANARNLQAKASGFYSRMRQAADRGVSGDEYASDEYEESNEMTVASRPMPPEGVSTKVLEWSRGGQNDGVRPMGASPANRSRRVPVEPTLETEGWNSREIEQGIQFDAPIERNGTIRR